MKIFLNANDNQYRILAQTEMKSDNTEVITQQAIKYDLNGNKRFVTDGRGKTIDNTLHSAIPTMNLTDWLK